MHICGEDAELAMLCARDCLESNVLHTYTQRAPGDDTFKNLAAKVICYNSKLSMICTAEPAGSRVVLNQIC